MSTMFEVNFIAFEMRFSKIYYTLVVSNIKYTSLHSALNKSSILLYDACGLKI